jgi:LmbE family N-acetylglucosaminyl deacetylase
MLISGKRILLLSSHTDDCELGAGGFIAKLVENGNTVRMVIFSIAEISVPNGYPKDVLLSEAMLSAETLGIGREDVIIHRFPARIFNENRQGILEILVEENKNFNPHIVLLPTTADIHQDHQVITNEGIRAFKNTSILGYEQIWNNLSSNLRFYVMLQEWHLQKKIDCLKCYQSQQHRRYMNEEFVRSLAISRGVQVNTEYAEAFEVIRWII